MADELEPNIDPASASVNSHLFETSEALAAALSGLTKEQAERVTKFIETQQVGGSWIERKLNALHEQLAKELQDKALIVQEFADYRTRSEAHAKKLQESIDGLTLLHTQSTANSDAALVAARAADKAISDVKFAQLEMRLAAAEERAAKQDRDRAAERAMDQVERARDKAESAQDKAKSQEQIAKIVIESQSVVEEIADLRTWAVSKASYF